MEALNMSFILDQYISVTLTGLKLLENILKHLRNVLFQPNKVGKTATVKPHAQAWHLHILRRNPPKHIRLRPSRARVDYHPLHSSKGKPVALFVGG
jgi:hypothetical protein